MFSTIAYIDTEVSCYTYVYGNHNEICILLMTQLNFMYAKSNPAFSEDVDCWVDETNYIYARSYVANCMLDH